MKSLLTIEHIIIQELGKVIINLFPFLVKFLILIGRQFILVGTHFVSRINTASQLGDETAKRGIFTSIGLPICIFSHSL